MKDKIDMARSIASKLVADNYIQFYNTTTDFGGVMIEARLDVVRPERGGKNVPQKAQTV